MKAQTLLARVMALLHAFHPGAPRFRHPPSFPSPAYRFPFFTATYFTWLPAFLSLPTPSFSLSVTNINLPPETPLSLLPLPTALPSSLPTQAPPNGQPHPLSPLAPHLPPISWPSLALSTSTKPQPTPWSPSTHSPPPPPPGDLPCGFSCTILGIPVLLWLL